MAKKFKAFGKGGKKPVRRAEGGPLNVSGDDKPIDVSEAARASLPKASPDIPSEPATFGAAFRAARNSGAKTFTWRGKSFTTQTKEDAAPARRAPAASRPSTSTSRPATPSPARASAPRPDTSSADKYRTGPRSNASSTRNVTTANTTAADKYRTTPRSTSNFTQGDTSAARRLAKPSPTPTPRSAPRRATTSEVTATDIAGRKRNLTSEQKRKLDAAVARSGTRSSFAKGGSVSRGDGIAKKGKTKGRFL